MASRKQSMVEHISISSLTNLLALEILDLVMDLSLILLRLALKPIRELLISLRHYLEFLFALS